MCRTIRPNGGRPAWFADPMGATERRRNGFKSALRKMRVPLVLQRRIFTLCTKVHAKVWRKIPCRRVTWMMSLLPKNHVLTGHRGTSAETVWPSLETGRSEKKQQPWAPECSIRQGETPNKRSSYARNPFIDRRPVRGFASATKSRVRAPECSELRR